MATNNELLGFAYRECAGIPRTRAETEALAKGPTSRLNIMTIGAGEQDVQEIIGNPEVRLLSNFGSEAGLKHRSWEYAKFAVDAVVVFLPTTSDAVDLPDLVVLDAPTVLSDIGGQIDTLIDVTTPTVDVFTEPVLAD